MDALKLKAAITAKGYTYRTLEKATGISASRLSRKINDKGKGFTTREARVLISTLEMSPAMAYDIFLS